MCKVLLVPNIKDNKRKLTIDFIKTMGRKMSVSNDDGLGYAAIDAAGNLFAERWLLNAKAFTRPTKETPEVYNKFSKMFKNFTGVAEDAYTSYGTPDLHNAKAVTLHTRWATTAKGLQNCHPFIDRDTSVIHNGIIRNQTDFDLKLSTCDSEAILISYLENDIGINPKQESIQDMADALMGYMVSMLFSRDAAGNRVLDVFKQHNNNLYMSFIYELDTYIMTTSELDIKAVCELMGLTYAAPQQIIDPAFMRINPFTGDILATNTFTPGKEFVYVANTNRNGYYDYSGKHWNHGNLNTPALENLTEQSKVITLPVNKPAHNVKRNTTFSMIEYYKSKPEIAEFSEQETYELLKIYNWN